MQKNIKNWVIGNWKCNPASLQDAVTLATQIQSLTTDLNDIQLMVMPTNLHISTVVQQLETSHIHVGCQDIAVKTQTTGAYTGDISSAQMKDMAINWTLLGHSERRMYHEETEEQLLIKMQNAFTQQLNVVFCIGENRSEYEANNTLEVLYKQLSILKELDNAGDYADNFIIAYEPVWAIGTGLVPTIEEVENVHQSIRQYLTSIDRALENVSVIYGGSVNDENVAEFAKSQWINGALVGGASLKAEKFSTIAQQFFDIKNKLLN